jgi:hypothetical protein
MSMADRRLLNRPSPDDWVDFLRQDHDLQMDFRPMVGRVRTLLPHHRRARRLLPRQPN